MSQPQTNQIQTMLDLQHSMNSKVNADWKNQKFEWYRAIWIECAELLDHYGWKWWKHQETEYDQVVLELIDIWHFGLSNLIERDVSADEICRELTLGLDDKLTLEFPLLLEAFTEEVLRSRSFDVKRFGGLMQLIELDFDELFSRYVGKNVLNMFRQDKGYKEGTYHKSWGGRDDNEWLVHEMRSLDSNRSDFAEALYCALEATYPLESEAC